MADIRDIYQKFYTIGAAISRINANNTHSGNLSMRDPEDADRFYVSASGCQCGALVPRDIVPVRFSDVSWGDARGSTESTIHRKVLMIPGVNAVVHAHYIYASVISFDSQATQLFLHYLGADQKGREEFLFHPVDLFGAYILGGIKVGSYVQPVGSPEMEERLPLYLADNRLTIVRGHGPFARGHSLEDCFYRLNVLEQSALLTLNLRRRGVDVTALQRALTTQGKAAVFQAVPHVLNEAELTHCDVADQSVLTDFRQRLTYNYNNRIGAYGTGSLSQKVTADEMLFCPMSAVPEGMNFPLYRLPIECREDDSVDLSIHKLIYQHTHQNTCMITVSPLAISEGMAVLAEQYGLDALLKKETAIPYTPENHPVVSPIDAEAIYLNPRLGLVDFWQLLNRTPENPILNMLRWYKGCCVVAGYGVISTGDTTLEQAAHNAASAERIAQFRAEVFINEKLLHGPSMQSFENRTL
jgi:ribulose-5-phosphate 4-epimerase/fuculose-1-phosphate aldolase